LGLFRRCVKLENLLEVTNYFGRNSVTLSENEENSIYRAKLWAFIAARFTIFIFNKYTSGNIGA